jgi:hypothetical protein
VYFKFLEAGNKLEINALSSLKNDEIFSSELGYVYLRCLLVRFRMEKELKAGDFDNLDGWVKKEIMPKYEKEILNKLLRQNK